MVYSGYPGGWGTFLASRPNRLCADDEIAAQGFASEQSAQAFVENLQEQGLSGEHVAIVDPVWGVLNECDWLELGNAKLFPNAHVTVCRLVGSTDDRFFTPPGWTYQGSLSERAVGLIH